MWSCGEDISGGDTSFVTGKGGSTARMTISGKYLYAISGRNVQLFDINTPSSPMPWTKIGIAWDIQTLFPYGDYLLIGAADGVHIMDNTDPASPRYVADFTHVTSKDPVVAQDGFAYVTLASDNTRPNGFIDDQLNVLDISDITEPGLVSTIPMIHPSGLAVQGNSLFVCDGQAGLKVFDLSDHLNLNVKDWLGDVNCRDVIAQNNILYVMTADAMLQYDYSSKPMTLLSEIKVDD